MAQCTLGMCAHRVGGGGGPGKALGGGGGGGWAPPAGDNFKTVSRRYKILPFLLLSIFVR